MYSNITWNGKVGKTKVYTFINFCKIKILWNFTLIQVEFDLNYLKLFMIFTNDSFVIINKQK